MLHMYVIIVSVIIISFIFARKDSVMELSSSQMSLCVISSFVSIGTQL